MTITHARDVHTRRITHNELIDAIKRDVIDHCDEMLRREDIDHDDRMLYTNARHDATNATNATTLHDAINAMHVVYDRESQIMTICIILHVIDDDSIERDDEQLRRVFALHDIDIDDLQS